MKSAAAETIVPQAEVEEAQAARRAQLLDFFRDPPAEALTAAQALGRARERYGDDAERARADLDSGRHPLKRTKTKPR
jgi:hypothetical protein